MTTPLPQERDEQIARLLSSAADCEASAAAATTEEGRALWERYADRRRRLAANLSDDLTPPRPGPSRAEVAEQIVRIMAPYAESTTHPESDLPSAVISAELAERSLLSDYLRIKEDAQADAFEYPLPFAQFYWTVEEIDVLLTCVQDAITREMPGFAVLNALRTNLAEERAGLANLLATQRALSDTEPPEQPHIVGGRFVEDVELPDG